MMIDTIKGQMDESSLEKREGSLDDDNESTSWVEYWLDGEMVHRSAHVHLKQGITALMTQGAFQ
jgi:hypothetical protein